MNRRALLLGAAAILALAGEAVAQSRRAVGPLRNGRRGQNGVAGPVSEAAFNAAMAAKATNGAKASSSLIAYNGSGGVERYYTDMAPPSSYAMAGSPWAGRRFGFAGGAPSAVDKFVLHCCPSQAINDAIVAVGGRVYYQVKQGPDGDYPGYSRNGYPSNDFGGLNGSAYCDDFIYRDPTTGIPMRMNPFAGLGPTPYVLGTP